MNPKTLRKPVFAVILATLVLAVAVAIALTQTKPEPNRTETAALSGEQAAGESASALAEDPEAVETGAGLSSEKQADPAGPASYTPAQTETRGVTHRFGVVEDVENTGRGPIVVLDRAQLLPADETAHPSAAELVFFNDTKDLIKIPVAEDAVVAPAGESDSPEIAFSEWARTFLSGPESQPVAVWVEIRDGVAVRIQEQVIP